MRYVPVALALFLSVGCATTQKSVRYAVVNHDSIEARDATVDGVRLAELRQSIGQDFVWFEPGGSEYTTTSADVIARANAAIREVRDAKVIAGRDRVNQNYDSVAPLHADPFAFNTMFAPERPIDEMPGMTRHRALMETQQQAALKTDRAMAALLDEAVRKGLTTTRRK